MEGGQSLRSPDIAQHVSKVDPSVEDDSVLAEPMRRTESPFGDVHICALSSETKHRPTAYQSPGDIWVKYILENLLFTGKQRTYPAVPGRRTEASFTLLISIYDEFLLCHRSDTSF